MAKKTPAKKASKKKASSKKAPVKKAAEKVAKKAAEAAAKMQQSFTIDPKPTPTGQVISEVDLQQFLAASEIVDRARADLRMIILGFEALGTALRDRYKIEGKFEINSRTGQVISMPQLPPVG